MNRGKLLIFFMFASAAVVSGYAIWYRHQESRIVLQHMPPGVAAVIAYPMQAQLQRLIPAPSKEAAANLPSPDEIIRVGGKSYWVVEQKDAMTVGRFPHRPRLVPAQRQFRLDRGIRPDRPTTGNTASPSPIRPARRSSSSTWSIAKY